MDAYEEGLRARVWTRVRQRPSGCWEWAGATRGKRGKAAYGHIKVHGVSMSPHRLVWEWFNGEIPPGMCILHRCDNRRCVNPGHLFLGTYKDNAIDAVRKGRMSPPVSVATRVREDGFVRCGACLEFLPPEDFNKDRARSHGCQSYCKRCHSVVERNRERGKLNGTRKPAALGIRDTKKRSAGDEENKTKEADAR